MQKILTTPPNTAFSKRVLIIVHDLVMTALALVLTVWLRFDQANIDPRLPELAVLVPLFLPLAAVVYQRCRLYASKWRFASLPDLFNIFRAVSMLALALLAIDLAVVARSLTSVFIYGGKGIALYWMVQLFLLGGPRLCYRYMKYVRSRRAGKRDLVPSVLVLGRSTEAEIVLRALETGLRYRFRARGILSSVPGDAGMAIRGVPVLGTYADIKQVIGDFAETSMPISQVIFAPSEFASDADSERVMATARRLGVAVYRMQTLADDSSGGASLKLLDVEDILFRPPVKADPQQLPRFLAGKRVLVTGAGGTIGSALCLRLADFQLAQLIVVDSSEPALYALLEMFETRRFSSKLHGTVADIRDRARLFQLFRDLKPDFVFHAAALKHVPQLEQDWSEGIKTNVFGTVNVTDAASSIGAAMVLISTDKAVNPVSILGATKRLSEMYVQMRDAEATAEPPSARLISVRFGNVLVSSGSVVPKFKAQIARGGPVTVTHPDMVRYFMTVGEAADLVLIASAHAMETTGEVEAGASVYVLRMGQPARIVDLAERLIRLAGFEPGREIDIVFTGMRKGERLNESIFAADESVIDVGVDGVMAARTPVVDRTCLMRWLTELSTAVQTADRATAERVFGEAFVSYRSRNIDELAPKPAASPDPSGKKIAVIR